MLMTRNNSLNQSTLVPDMLIQRKMLMSFYLEISYSITATGSKSFARILLLMTCNGIRYIYWQLVPPPKLNHCNIQASKLYDTTSATQTGNNHQIQVGLSPDFFRY